MSSHIQGYLTNIFRKPIEHFCTVLVFDLSHATMSHTFVLPDFLPNFCLIRPLNQDFKKGKQ